MLAKILQCSRNDLSPLWLWIAVLQPHLGDFTSHSSPMSKRDSSGPGEADGTRSSHTLQVADYKYLIFYTSGGILLKKHVDTWGNELLSCPDVFLAFMLTHFYKAQPVCLLPDSLSCQPLQKATSSPHYQQSLLSGVLLTLPTSVNKIYHRLLHSLSSCNQVLCFLLCVLFCGKLPRSFLLLSCRCSGLGESSQGFFLCLPLQLG